MPPFLVLGNSSQQFLQACHAGKWKVSYVNLHAVPSQRVTSYNMLAFALLITEKYRHPRLSVALGEVYTQESAQG